MIACSTASASSIFLLLLFLFFFGFLDFFRISNYIADALVADIELEVSYKAFHEICFNHILNI